MGKESFLARWSRLKRAAAVEAPAATSATAPTPAAPAAATTSAVPAELPPVEGLDFGSDFSAFLQPEVEESVKRAALKKLFHSEHFNRMDGLDVYIDDYSRFEPIPEEMLAQLEHARDLLFSPRQMEGNTPSPGEGNTPSPEPQEAARVDENQPPAAGTAPTDPPAS